MYSVGTDGGIESAIRTTYDESSGTISAIFAHQSIYAVLEVPKHTVSVVIEGNGKATAYPVDALMEGDVVTLSALAEEGYIFLGWSSDQVTITDGKFIMPNDDVVIKATFGEDIDMKNRKTLMIVGIIGVIA